MLVNSVLFKLYLNRLNELEALIHLTEIKAIVGMGLLLSIEAEQHLIFEAAILDLGIAGSSYGCRMQASLPHAFGARFVFPDSYFWQSAWSFCGFAQCSLDCTDWHLGAVGNLPCSFKAAKME